MVFRAGHRHPPAPADRLVVWHLLPGLGVLRMPEVNNAVWAGLVPGRPRHAARDVRAGDPAAGLAAVPIIGPIGSYRELGPQDHLSRVHGVPRNYRPRLSEHLGHPRPKDL